MGSLRTEFTQTFLNADGTYTLVENTEAIAFKNQKGELELFDNTVIENVHTVNDTEYLYSNTAGYYKVYFGNQTEGNAPILLANAGNSIQIASSLSKNLTVHKATDAKLLNNSNELFSIDEVQKCVFYGHDNDCESGIIYSPHNNALNQKVVFINEQAVKDITFTINSGDLLARENKGEVEFYSNNNPLNTLFCLAAPITIDANGKNEVNATISLLSTKKPQREM